MDPKLAGVINCLIGAGLMASGFFLLKKKHAEQPGMKIYGLSFKAVSIIFYVGMVIFALLIIAVLAGLD